MSCLSEDKETGGLQLVLLPPPGTLHYDKGIELLHRDVGNCPSNTTDVTCVPSFQRQLSSVIPVVWDSTEP